MAKLSRREIRALILLLPFLGIFITGAFLIISKVETQKVHELEVEIESHPSEHEVKLFGFDPNSVEYADLRLLGLSKYEAVSLLKYRASGKVFRIKEDVALCYGFSDSLYFRLEPYINIGAEYKIKSYNSYKSYNRDVVVVKRAPLVQFRIDTATSKFFQSIGALSRRQADALIKWRNISGIYNIDDLRECYTVSDSLALALEPYVIFPEESGKGGGSSMLDINTADSIELLSVYGIGEKTAGRIVRYRERLGGFVKIEQLAEVQGVMQGNYEKISKQISCKSYEIKKINLNFASAIVVSAHPYVAPRTLRRILKTRQLKGGWSSTEEMVRNNILTEKEAERLAPYLQFGAPTTTN